mgnify:CR=1 FL=1
MTRYAKTMSQALAEVQMRELKMNDPKLIKVFDKLKPKDTIKLELDPPQAGNNFNKHVFEQLLQIFQFSKSPPNDKEILLHVSNHVLTHE